MFSKRLEKIPQVPLLFPFIFIILTNYSKMEVAVESQASFFKTSQDIATCIGVENCYSSFSRRPLEQMFCKHQSKNVISWTGMVAHTCNPSTLGGQDGVSFCHPDRSAMAPSQLTATSTSRVQAILPPQPPEYPG
ncbi:TCF4 isoform 3 [Pan troglodytes]|uniref:TCF4 isoform 3 n=2 Tax=Pan troglodytes TaxID=9598 RepID=A0A2J8NDQ2_PANTR|nr:TCF4 isoform 3 [Pan troglodytes]